jgi:AcrR family transcriptional regulator
MPNTTNTYKSERQVERRAKILRTARRLVSEVGYDGLTMRGLAAAAQVSPKTLYNLFVSKDELLMSALDDLMQGLFNSIQQAENVEGFDYLFLRQDTYNEEIMRSPGYAALTTRALFQARPNNRLVRRLLAAPIQEFLTHLTFEKKKGILIDGLDLEHVSRQLALQDWCVLLLWNKGEINLEDIPLEKKRALLMTLVGITRGSSNRRYHEQLMSLTA